MNLNEGLVFAAISGAMLGALGCAENQAMPETPSAVMGEDRGGAAHHACAGQNECKGKGGCKTDKHACKGQNECKGQGGCKTA